VKQLFKSTIIIWTEYDPSALEVELTDLAHQSESGDAYCSTMDCVLVTEPEKDAAWDGTDFFDIWDEEEDTENRSAGPENRNLEMRSTSTPAAQPQVCDLAGDGQPLLTETPHFCPLCLTGYGCEDKPCTAAYESTCKSCIAGCADRVGGTPTGYPCA
jgi:hypothetical protein